MIEHLINPTPELPDETPIEDVQLPTRLRKALATAGLKTVGETRESQRNTAELPGSWAGLGHTHSKDLGLAVD
jgi:hypothetical protein